MKWRLNKNEWRGVVATIIFLIAAIYVLFFGAGWVRAETVPQMRLRVLQEYIDKYNLSATCNDACVDARIANGNDWLVPLARQLGIDYRTVARASIGYSIDWGFKFENLYKRPPSIYDWIEAYPNINDGFRELLNASPSLYRVNKWDYPNRDYKYKLEYGGQY